MKFTMWDVGGQDMVQTLWKYYYRNVNTLVFVVDSSDRYISPEVGTSANPQIADSSFYLRICEPNFVPQIFADLR